MRPNPPKHIGESISFQRQKFEWWKIPLETVFKFEIINWWKMTTKNFRSTWYCEFACKLLSPIKGAKEGDIVILNIPYHTFERAIDSTDMNYKRFMSEEIGNDNVHMEIKKSTKSRMEITYMERKAEDEEMTLKAKKILYGVEEK